MFKSKFLLYQFADNRLGTSALNFFFTFQILYYIGLLNCSKASPIVWPFQIIQAADLQRSSPEQFKTISIRNTKEC